jgi:hypothetical protein
MPATALVTPTLRPVLILSSLAKQLSSTPTPQPIQAVMAASKCTTTTISPALAMIDRLSAAERYSLSS